MEWSIDLIRRDSMDHECICSKQTNEDDFTEEQWKSIDEVTQKYRGKPGALIPVLEEVQGITGYLPESVQRRVASGLNLPLSQVYGVTTFYSFFTMKPRGKHQIRVCLGTACHVRGAKRNLDHITQAFNLKPGECTEDRQFSLEVVRCLGACGLAPVMLVDEDTHKQVKEAKLDQIMKKYHNGSMSSEG
jgi:NADH-quinone oxidoreductase subunit E/NADP-reducing hydrogenase subunit HndA